ncbi:TPA: hypothetical protein ACSP1Y_004698 [Aeromonas hydrophila]
MQMLTERIDVLDKKLAELSSQQVADHHSLTIPRVGPLITAAIHSDEIWANLPLNSHQHCAVIRLPDHLLSGDIS